MVIMPMIAARMVMMRVAMTGMVMIVVMMFVVAMMCMDHGLILHALESCSKRKQARAREKRGRLALAYG